MVGEDFDPPVDQLDIDEDAVRLPCRRHAERQEQLASPVAARFFTEQRTEWQRAFDGNADFAAVHGLGSLDRGADGGQISGPEGPSGPPAG